MANKQLQYYRNIIRMALYIALLVIIIVPKSHAGGYVLSEDADSLSPPTFPGLCEKFEQNLNIFSAKPPMACEVKIHPSMKMFSKPNWIAFDLKKNLPLVEEIARARTEHLSDEKQDYYCSLAKQHTSSDVAKFSKAQIDLSNTGSTVPVVRYDFWRCDEADRTFIDGMRLPGLVVLDRGEKILDSAYETLNRSRSGYDVIIYEGQTFLTRWWGTRSSPDYKLTVHRVALIFGDTFSINAKPTCTYRYQD